MDNLESEILKLCESQKHFPTLIQLIKTLNISKHYFKNKGGYRKYKDDLIKKHNLNLKTKCNQSYSYEFSEQEFKKDVLDELKIYSLTKKYSEKSSNFVLLEHVCYKNYNKSLIRFAIEDLKINWREICDSPPRWYYDDFNKLEVDLLGLCEKIGHFPTVKQCKEFLGIGFGCFKKHGGYLEVRKSINYNEKLIDASNYINKSHAEYAIAQYLIYNKIKYSRDVVISPNPKLDGKYNCDFVIETKEGLRYWIEYWGLNSDEYLKTKKIKQELYKKYNLNLISIESNDYYKNSYKKFQEILEKKIIGSSLKKVDKTNMFFNYSKMDDAELSDLCFNKEGDLIPITKLSSKVSSEIRKRYDSYHSFLKNTKGIILENSKEYREHVPIFYLKKLFKEYGEIPSKSEIDKKYKGLTKFISKNISFTYWKINTYIELIKEGLTMPPKVVKNLKYFLNKNKTLSGKPLSPESLNLIQENKNIIMEVF